MMSSACAGWELSLSRLQQCIVGDGVGGRLNEERDALADLSSSVSLLVEERVGEGEEADEDGERERWSLHTHRHTNMCNSQSLDYLLMSAMQRLNTKERLQTDRTCSVSAELVSEAQLCDCPSTLRIMLHLSCYCMSYVVWCLSKCLCTAAKHDLCCYLPFMETCFGTRRSLLSSCWIRGH